MLRGARFQTLFLFVGLPAACSDFRGPLDIAQLQCEAAGAMVEQLLTERARRHVFALEPAATLDAQPMGDGEWYAWQGGERVTAPSADLQRAFLRQTPESAIARCPSIRQLLQQRQGRYGRIPQSIPIQNDLYPANIESVSLPAVSEDGRRAVLAYSGVSGPEAAGGHLIYLVRQRDGQWRVAGRAGLWIS